MIEKAFGYQGNPLSLPVADVPAAVPFYENVLGFQVVSHSESQPRSATLARDRVQIRLEENGGDPSQDGCAFHVSNLDGLLEELQRRGLKRLHSDIKIEPRDGAAWRVFYVVAPDGLCYWFGERQ